jgi:hypothetical protein
MPHALGDDPDRTDPPETRRRSAANDENGHASRTAGGDSPAFEPLWPAKGSTGDTIDTKAWGGEDGSWKSLVAPVIENDVVGGSNASCGTIVAVTI